ncbi:hypothetical protein [Helicobacter rodentium]|uniref:hypothetical protein n=1 Tax=Helicobacter rodentium TaxID=59617 RepID=UPI0004793FB1|nr:hypothetical protein [Helicobacter rodentium]
MPLPLIPIAVAGGTLLSVIFAGTKGKEAYDNYKKAGELVNQATENYNKAESALKKAQENVADEFDELGFLQKSIIENSLERYKNLIDQLDIKDSKELQEIIGKETIENITQIEQVITALKSALSGIVAGGVAGGMAGFGAVGGVGLLATAGTGTAISSLSGVAATNATLAWLGGGTLASGGLGIAGGMWVLGGIVAAPLVAVTSIVVAMFSEGKLNDAQAYYESFNALREVVKSEQSYWKEMINKIKEKAKILQESDVFLKSQIDKVFTTFVQKGHSVSKWEAEEQERLKSMMQLAQTIVYIINAPLMNDEDPLTKEIMAHQKKSEELIKEINAKWGK